MLQKIDDRDVKILKILAQNGRIKISELARELNLTSTPCWERVRRLEKLGIIQSYKAELSLQKIAPYITIFVVLDLENHKAETFQRFESIVRQRDDVTACWALGGGYDYLLQIVSRDIEHYQALMDSFLDQRIGISHYVTYVVTKPIKMSSVPPFDILLA